MAPLRQLGSWCTWKLSIHTNRQPERLCKRISDTLWRKALFSSAAARWLGKSKIFSAQQSSSHSLRHPSSRHLMKVFKQQYTDWMEEVSYLVVQWVYHALGLPSMYLQAKTLLFQQLELRFVEIHGPQSETESGTSCISTKSTVTLNCRCPLR